jgi:hypothetical protein
VGIFVDVFVVFTTNGAQLVVGDNVNEGIGGA